MELRMQELRELMQGIKENKIAIIIIVVVHLLVIGSCYYGLTTNM